MVKLVNKVFILVVFIAFLFCGSQDNAYNNKLLFCLKNLQPQCKKGYLTILFLGKLSCNKYLIGFHVLITARYHVVIQAAIR